MRINFINPSACLIVILFFFSFQLYAITDTEQTIGLESIDNTSEPVSHEDAILTKLKKGLGIESNHDGSTALSDEANEACDDLGGYCHNHQDPLPSEIVNAYTKNNIDASDITYVYFTVRKFNDNIAYDKNENVYQSGTCPNSQTTFSIMILDMIFGLTYKDFQEKLSTANTYSHYETTFLFAVARSPSNPDELIVKSCLTVDAHN